MLYHNTQLTLAKRPIGMPQADDFKVEHQEINSLEENCFIVAIEYVSIDPAMRGWMNEGTTYVPGVAIGAVMRAFAVGKIVASNNNSFRVGDIVQGLFGAQHYAISDGKGVSKCSANVPMSYHIGILGMPGLTAYFGLLDKGALQKGETVLVSAAAGMIGSLVGQIAKQYDCTVIGIAGGAEKCDYIRNELGFDEVVDYKKVDVAAQIKEAAPDGVDVYFDNVGGDILDAAMLNLARGARVVICGAIAQYNESSFAGLKNYMKIVTARGVINGIIVFDYFDRAEEAFTQITTWLNDGKIKYREHVVNGVDNFAAALQMLFTGKNNGKLILKIKNDE